MILELCEEAQDFGRSALGAIEAAGGDRLVQAAEADPAQRQAAIEPVLAGLGAWQLEPRRNLEEMEAAAALCRSAGHWALPYPVAARLCRPAAGDFDGLLVVSDVEPAAPVAGLGLRWAAAGLDGQGYAATARPAPAAPRRSAFVTRLDLQPAARVDTADLALALTLPCWTLLGMLDRAMALTCAYVLERQQFGQPLASFQGVQFQLTDAEVERVGVEELAKYALWSIESGRPDAVDDALALRAAAVEAAEIVFRVAHQLHGAIGFCDETTISWMSRYSAPLRRLPLGLTATRTELTRRLGRQGLAGLFSSPSSTSQ
ncbi:MAG: acyl-CoA dehydrogenase family protein [Actinomycetota bacterium]|nr:acyl-CoA dehydrogenase family protein [Actinomycetota bacterium]